MPVPLHPADPVRLGRYALDARLSQGGMGTIYLGHSVDSGRPVAVKVIRPELTGTAEFRARFRSEVNRVREVPAFCTAAVLDADPDHETPYLVVEYVEGPNLTQVLRERGPLGRHELVNLAVGVATALAAIHGAGVIHRDLKPGNVLFAVGGIKVIDFGIARAVETTSAHTRTDHLVGTVAYMAPERFEAEKGQAVTPAADIFAWGVLVAYAATGSTPFEGDSPMATAVRIMTREPDLTGLDGELRAVVERALDKKPERRPSAHELLRLMLPARPAPAPVAPRSRRRRLLFGLTAGAAVLAVAEVGVILRITGLDDDAAPVPAGEAAVELFETAAGGNLSLPGAGPVALSDQRDESAAFRLIPRDGKYLIRTENPAVPGDERCLTLTTSVVATGSCAPGAANTFTLVPADQPDAGRPTYRIGNDAGGFLLWDGRRGRLVAAGRDRPAAGSRFVLVDAAR